MQGLANERRLAPLLDRGGPGLPKENGRPARHGDGALRPFAPVRRALRATREMLDGVGGLGWSVLGFIGGAVFWHFVGFWGFVSNVVLAGGPPDAPAAARHGAPPPARPPMVQVADAAAPLCTLLSRDRETGLTQARPCGSDHPPLPADSYQGRQDRIDVTLQEGWSPRGPDGRTNP